MKTARIMIATGILAALSLSAAGCVTVDDGKLRPQRGMLSGNADGPRNVEHEVRTPLGEAHLTSSLVGEQWALLFSGVDARINFPEDTQDVTYIDRVGSHRNDTSLLVYRFASEKCPRHYRIVIVKTELGVSDYEAGDCHSQMHFFFDASERRLDSRIKPTASRPSLYWIYDDRKSAVFGPVTGAVQEAYIDGRMPLRTAMSHVIESPDSIPTVGEAPTRSASTGRDNEPQANEPEKGRGAGQGAPNDSGRKFSLTRAGEGDRPKRVDIPDQTSDEVPPELDLGS